MKKIFIISLALIFSLLFTGTALAAKRHFVDVPAKHWAYEAVNKLAQAGVIDGYGDRTFRGDRLMTRYEMAQIVLRAMEHYEACDITMKALIEKLSGEFSEELKDMRTRIDRLEKRQSTIKFWGDARIRYQDNWDLRRTTTSDDCFKKERFQERIRLYAQAEVSEKTEFIGRISAEHNSGENFCGLLDNDTSRKSVLTWEIGKFVYREPGRDWSFEIGRSDLTLGQGLVAKTDGGFDSIRFSFRNADNTLQSFYAYGDIAAATGRPFNWDVDNKDRSATVSVANVTWTPNENWTITAAGLYSHSLYYPYKVFSLGAKVKLQDWTLIVDAARNTSSQRFGDEKFNRFDKSAWMSTLWYKGADRRQQGTWGAFISYEDIGSRAIDGRLSVLEELATKSEFSSLYGYWHTGVKGFSFGFNYTVDKNVVLSATIKNLKAEQPGTSYATYVYAKLDFNF